MPPVTVRIVLGQPWAGTVTVRIELFAGQPVLIPFLPCQVERP